MDLLTRAELALLAQPQPGGTCVSLFMPTHRFGDGIDADRLRWKNLITGVEAVLAKQMRRAEVEELLEPARRLHEDDLEWQYMSDGLSMYLGDGEPRTFRVPTSIPPLATVGDRYVMGPMLRLLSGDEHFFVLALSQRSVRLLEGNRNTVDEVQLGDVPTNLKDVVEAEEPRSDTMARPAKAAGRGGPAVFYGHGAGDRHLKKEEVVKFLREVSTGLHELLVGRTSPMVLVGLEHLVSAYRGINSYEHTVDDVVIHNPDQLSTDELHQMAWPVVEQRLRDDRSAVIERFHGLNGTGRVSSDLQMVADAAAEGRVDSLFVNAAPWCWEHDVSNGLPIVALGEDPAYADCERVDAAAAATLNNSGRVFAISEPVVPGSQVAAILRY